MCCHVLEHLSDPIKVVNEIKDLMQDGILYIEVPYEPYVQAIHNNKDAVILIHEHINFFTVNTFNEIFKDNNFVILENKYVDVPNVSGTVFCKHLQCLVKKTKDETLIALNSKNRILPEKIITNENPLCRKNKPSFLQQIFSIKNDGEHRILRVLGFKIKFKKRR